MARHPRPSGRLLAWRNSVFVVFGLSGLDLASWVARVPTVRDSLQASTLQMGLLIFGLAGGSIVGLLVSSHLIARITARKAILWSLTAGPTGLIVAGVGATAGRSFAMTFIGLAVFGLGAGLCDVAMNVSAAASERLLGHTIMPLYHACFSLGTVVGAALGALAETIRIPLGIHMAAIAISTILAVTLVAGRLQPEQSGQAEHAEHGEQSQHAEHGRTGPMTGSADRPPTGTWRSRLGAWRDPGTLLIGVVVLGMAFAEGSANDWLALAMVDGHGVSNAGGALVFAVFVGSMTAGRIAGSRLLDRFGRVAVLRASAVLAAIGLTIVIFVPDVPFAVAGTVLWGLGSSLGFPVGMSAAADDPATAAARVSAVATIGYCAFLVGPPVIGFLGEHVGLLHALLLVLLLIGAAGAAAGATRPKTGR